MAAFFGSSRKGPVAQPDSIGFWGNRGGMPLFRLPARLAFWLMLLALGAGFFFLTVHGYQGMRQIHHLAQKREGLVRENQELNKKNESLYREITRLKQDPLYLEEVARKEFGLVRPNEIIFFIDEEKIKETSPHGKSPAPDHRR
jgi:cell division protein FtsB